MRTVSIKLKDMAIANIQLGFVGENNATQVIFESKEIFDENPYAVQLLVVTPPEGTSYEVTTARIGDNVIWNVSELDTAFEGDGSIQLVFTDGSQVIKTYNADTTVLESKVPSGTAPATALNWIQDAEAWAKGTRGGRAVEDDDPTYQNNSKYFSDKIVNMASDSEAWAKGTRDGEAVESDDPAYNNNSKYYAESIADTASDSEAYAAGTRGGEAVDEDDPAYHNNAAYYNDQAALEKAAAQAAAETASAAYNVNLLAANYDATKTYAVGEYVIYNGGLYRCISAITTAEAWTAAHWSSVTVGKDTSALKSAISEEIESATLTSGISNTYHGVTFELSAPDTLKVYGTATATRRVLCLNGQNKETTSSTAFEKTLEKGVYNIETEITGALTENVAWSYTYTTFANMQISVTKNAPVGTFTFENPVMFGFSFSTGTNFGTSESPTYIKISAKKIVGNDEIARAEAEYIGEKSIIMRGKVTDFGTSFGSCTAPGAYSFTASDLATITDEPDGFNAGGLLITYVNGTRVWQEIKSTFEGFIRYGYTGAWKRQPETLLVTYTSGSGDDSSDAQITIDIPKGVAGRAIRYKMGHCADADSNADVWRLMYMYYVLSNGTATQMNRHGEFECALHLYNRDDFSGGITHGDEIDQNVTFLMDGQPVTASNANGFCKEFRIIRNSILYDPADHTTAIANHGCEYIFTNEGLTINQSIKWLVAETLTSCYLAMLPIYKTFSTYRYDDVSFVVTENTGSSYSVTVPGATSVTEYNTDVSTTMEVPKYPTGLTGGDCALITDNNGQSYNKVYFVVCTGGNSSINELWKSKTVFKCA